MYLKIINKYISVFSVDLTSLLLFFMKNKLLILPLIIFYNLSFAQSYSEIEIDSLLDVAAKLRKTKSAEALSLYKEIYNYSKKNNYPLAELKSLDNIAHSYYALGKMEKSIHYAVLQEKKASEKNNSQYIALALRIKAIAYSKLGFHEDANEIIQKAFSISDKIASPDEMHKTKGLLHEAYIVISINTDDSTQKEKSILFHLKNATREFSKIKSVKLREEKLAEQYPALGDEYTDLGKFDSAHYYFKKALLLSIKSNDLYTEYLTLFCLGRLSYSEGKYDEAVYYFKDVVKKAQIHENPYMVKSAYESLQYCYSALNDKAKMQEYFNKYTKISDSITKIEKEAVTTPFKQILREKEESSSKQLSLAISIILVSFFLLFLLYRYNQNRITKKKTLELERNMQQLEYKALKSQMNPHFVFNILNNMQSMMILKGEAEVNKYFVAFSRLLRQTLDISNQEVVSLKEEIGYLNNYLILNNLQFNEELNFAIIVDKNALDTEKIFIPGMLIQPFVENALIHGLSPKK
ncbi:MAG: hypothetical protein EOP00_18945, partial [Pedobacter sp.]